MLHLGAPLPRLHARPVAGRTVDTAAFADGTLVLVFLRHAGSAVTRSGLLALDRAWDDLERRQVGLVAVIEGSSRAAFDVVPRLKVRFPVLHDRDGQHYAAFEVGRDAGLWRTAADPRSLGRWLTAVQAGGHGAPGGPVDRRCAAYVAVNGVIAYAWEARTAVEGPPTDAIVDATRATARR
jgi:peroxiredoxin